MWPSLDIPGLVNRGLLMECVHYNIRKLCNMVINTLYIIYTLALYNLKMMTFLQVTCQSMSNEDKGFCIVPPTVNTRFGSCLRKVELELVW